MKHHTVYQFNFKKNQLIVDIIVIVMIFDQKRVFLST